MPIENDEIKNFVTEYLDIDIEKVESVDKLKEEFATTFARKEVFKAELAKDASFVNPLIGKRLGSIETKVKQIAKDKLGLEFEGGEFKDKSIEDILELSADKYKSKYETDIAEVKKNITSTPDDIVKEWEKKLQIVNEEKENWKIQASKANEEKENFIRDWDTKEKTRKINDTLENTFKAIEFAPEANELTLEGFRAKILSEVKFDFDESGNFITFDKEGKTVFNPKKNGVAYSASEFVKDKAIEHKIFKLNGDGGKKVETFVHKGNPDTQTTNTSNQKVLNPRATQY